MDVFAGSLLLTLRIVSVGWLWSQSSSKTDRFLDRSGRAVVIGVLLNLLPALAAASVQIWTPVVDWSMWAVIVAMGAARSLAGQFRSQGRIVHGVSTAALVGLLLAVAVALPLRSEWLAGGWDPGIYQNNAVSIAQHNGISPLRNSVYAQLTVPERELLSAAEGSYREIFPGVPIRVEDGSLPRYFFHLTSVCGAWVYRLGGLELLNRLPCVLAFLGLLPVLALLGTLGLQGVPRWAGALFWCISPLWWYHQAIPTSEMLQLFLLCGALLLYLQAMDKGAGLPVLAGLALFAGTVNRFDYPVFAGLLLLIAAWAEARADNPGRMKRIAFCLAALAMGIVWNLVYAQVTIARLHEKDHVLWIVLVPFIMSALAAFFLVRRSLPAGMEHALRVAMRHIAMAGAILLIVMTGMLSTDLTRELWFRVSAHLPILGDMSLRFFRLLSFHGPGWFFAVALGGLVLAHHGHETNGRLALLVMGLGIILLALVAHGGIAPIYPWALRRYFVYLMPFAALTLAFLTLHLWKGWNMLNKAWLTTGLILVSFAAFDGMRHSRDAFRVGDYLGMSEIVGFLSDHIQEGDVVVVDDPRWATPLLLAYGRDVLNGKPLWESRSPEYQREYLRMLKRVQSDNQRRVVWLTSTLSATDIYKLDLGSMKPILEKIAFAYPTVIHSNRGGAFAQRVNTATFGLYLWNGEAIASNADG